MEEEILLHPELIRPIRPCQPPPLRTPPDPSPPRQDRSITDRRHPNAPLHARARYP